MTAQFKLIRFPERHLTKGELFHNNEHLCDTLEDPVRDFNADGDLEDYGEDKIYGETAIPYGTYEMVVTYSPKFKKRMTLLKDVPHFSGIRVHWGRSIKNSLGCPLVGKANGDTLENTGMTDIITNIVQEYMDSDIKCYIEII